MTEGSNWRVDKIVRKPVPVPGIEGVTIPIPHMVNNRGASVVYIGSGREYQDYFSYRDGNISFKFTASRYSGSDGKNITSTYNVYLESVLRANGLDRSRDATERIKNDLSEALRICPSCETRFPVPEISRVIFS